MSKDFQHRRLHGEKLKTFADEIFFFSPPDLTRRNNAAVSISKRITSLCVFLDLNRMNVCLKSSAGGRKQRAKHAEVLRLKE